MNKVSIGFSRHNGNFLSWLIRSVEGSSFSHVYIRRNSKYGEYVYQASGLQVNFMSLDTFLEKNTIVEEYEFDIPEVMHDEMISFCIKYAGKPYSIKALFQLTGMLLFGLKFKGDGDTSFVCSELGNVFCRKVLMLDMPDEQDFQTPKSLNFYVKKYGKRII